LKIGPKVVQNCLKTGGLNWHFFRALGSALNDFLFVECGATGMMLPRRLWLSCTFPLAEFFDADSCDDDLRIAVMC
jgi:hypothetical protein